MSAAAWRTGAGRTQPYPRFPSITPRSLPEYATDILVPTSPQTTAHVSSRLALSSAYTASFAGLCPGGYVLRDVSPPRCGRV